MQYTFCPTEVQQGTVVESGISKYRANMRAPACPTGAAWATGKLWPVGRALKPCGNSVS